jgi:hypothetical protein
MTTLKSPFPPIVCPCCKVRPASEPRFPGSNFWDYYCVTCGDASRLIHTSVDDARQSIRKASQAVAVRALELCPKNHLTRRKLIKARLNKLAKEVHQ